MPAGAPYFHTRFLEHHLPVAMYGRGVMFMRAASRTVRSKKKKIVPSRFVPNLTGLPLPDTQPMPYRIAAADDHPVVLEGIRLMLDSIGGCELVSTAASLKELVSVCAATRPDLLVLDLNIEEKNSLDLVPDLQRRHPSLKILVFSAYQSPGLVKKALESGVQGYLLKDALRAEWVEALANLRQGKTYLSRQLKAERMATFHDESKLVDFLQLALLSEQEKKIIRLTAQGQSEREIAEMLFISKHTVHTHKKNIFKKLGLHTNADLVKLAYEKKLV
ncbi:MAG: response regulator transcription factor [Sphingobacteriaceae bacterium]|nr:response regulator transcription factor [Cytophagaceae bacterium]